MHDNFPYGQDVASVLSNLGSGDRMSFEKAILRALGVLRSKELFGSPHGGRAILAPIVALKPLSPLFLHPILLVPDWSPTQC
jgi:hypothetical protein